MIGRSPVHRARGLGHFDTVTVYSTTVLQYIHTIRCGMGGCGVSVITVLETRI